MGMREVQSTYTVSIEYDKRLYRQDIAGSIAHARMLARQEIIASGEADAIVRGLQEIALEIESGKFPWRPELEDIHMNIERRLFEKIGDVAGRLHTARSRNDQVALDVRMYARERCDEVRALLRDLRGALVELASANSGVIMPGYTHLQRAQPVLFAHHMLAYFEMFGRDARRFATGARERGRDAAGQRRSRGTPLPHRPAVRGRPAWLLQGSPPTAWTRFRDRDYLLEFQAAAAICMMHLSRMAEELIIWSSEEFGFVRLSDEYTTGSSIMPQKRNPDFAEISRGKTGRVYGNLMAMLTLLKGLPMTYNRDLQEDKEGFLDSADTLSATLTVFADMLPGLSLDRERMLEAANGGYVLATDIADYLVERGMPFREAHGVVARLSDHAAGLGRRFDELPLETYRDFLRAFRRGRSEDHRRVVA